MAHPSNPVTINIDGQVLNSSTARRWTIHLNKEKKSGFWATEADSRMRKQAGLQGPIDDAFNSPFLHVLPDKPGFSPETDAWVQNESTAQLSRWRTLFRGDARVKKASEVTRTTSQKYNLILWGDPASN